MPVSRASRVRPGLKRIRSRRRESDSGTANPRQHFLSEGETRNQHSTISCRNSLTLPRRGYAVGISWPDISIKLIDRSRSTATRREWETDRRIEDRGRQCFRSITCRQPLSRFTFGPSSLTDRMRSFGMPRLRKELLLQSLR